MNNRTMERNWEGGGREEGREQEETEKKETRKKKEVEAEMGELPTEIGFGAGRWTDLMDL